MNSDPVGTSADSAAGELTGAKGLHDYVAEMIAAWGKPLEILDAGAGFGALTSRLTAAGHVVDAIEPHPTRFRGLARRYYKLDLADPAVREIPDRYDVVLLVEVLEHLRDPLGALANLTPLLKVTGRVLITVPNVEDSVGRAYYLLRGRFPGFYDTQGYDGCGHIAPVFTGTIEVAGRELGYHLRGNTTFGPPRGLRFWFPAVRLVLRLLGATRRADEGLHRIFVLHKQVGITRRPQLYRS